jgi:Uma2 family endonuclease
MTTAQRLQAPVHFDDFVAWLPETSASRYELHREVIIEMPKPRGKHSEVAGFIAGQLFTETTRRQLPWLLPKECIVRSLDGESGYEPDEIVLDRPALVDEPRWERESILTLGKSIRLIVEVVSTNWQDDYATKLVDYEALEIQEYWIADYLALGGQRYIGNSKQPTLTLCSLVDGEYELTQFRGSDRVISPTFPELMLTAEQILNAGQ